jgi:hypothetical protein
VDGHPPEKRWGGSDEIGGSPRPTGSALSPEEVKDALRLTYRPPGRAERALDVWRACLRSGLALCAGAAAFALSLVIAPRDLGAVEPLLPHLSFAVGICVLSALFTHGLSRGRSWLYGWRRPAGWDWWLPALVIPLGGAAGAVWTPQPLPVWDVRGVLWLVATCLAVALASELWFRGWVHGLFLTHGPVQWVRGRWFLSQANAWAGLIYAGMATCLAPLMYPVEQVSSWADFAGLGRVAGVALAGGWLLGLVRERSLSVWPCVAAHGLAILAGVARGIAQGY